MALSERMRQEQAERARLVRMLSPEELADCCGGCRSNSAIETWMRRAIVRFCEVNGIRLADGVQEFDPGLGEGSNVQGEPKCTSDGAQENGRG